MARLIVSNVARVAPSTLGIASPCSAGKHRLYPSGTEKNSGGGRVRFAFGISFPAPRCIVRRTAQYHPQFRAPEGIPAAFLLFSRPRKRHNGLHPMQEKGGGPRSSRNCFENSSRPNSPITFSSSNFQSGGTKPFQVGQRDLGGPYILQVKIGMQDLLRGNGRSSKIKWRSAQPECAFKNCCAKLVPARYGNKRPSRM